MNILLVNDDSVYSPGIIALAKALKDKHDVTIIAPERQQSGTSHSITFYGYINFEKIDLLEGVESYILSGTPCDCTKFGLDTIIKNKKIDLVISGINNGYNLGTDILYSGTVNAAIEGTIFNIKSIAVSQNYGLKSYDYSASFIADNLDKLMSLIEDPSKIAISINIPSDNIKDIKGVKMALVGENRYGDYYVYEKMKGYRICGDPIRDLKNNENADVELIKKNYITISYVKFDFNDNNLFNKNKDFVL